MCSFSLLLSVKVLLTKWNPKMLFLSQFLIDWKVLNLFLLSFSLPLVGFFWQPMIISFLTDKSILQTK